MIKNPFTRKKPKPQSVQSDDLPELVPARQRKLTPARIAAVIEAANRGQTHQIQDLYREMEMWDSQVFSEFTKRKSSASSREWSLFPPAGASDREASDTALVENLIRKSTNIGEAIYDLADGIGKGFSLVEIEWMTDGKYYYPHKFHWIPQTQFDCTENEYRLRRRDGGSPEQLWPNKWIIHEFSAYSGRAWQRALFLPIVVIYMYKTYSLRDWSEFLDKFGLPIMLGKYPDGAGTEIKNSLRTALFGLSHAFKGITNSSTTIDLVTPPAGTDPAAFLQHIEHLDRQISKIMAGGTLSGNEGTTGSYGQAKIHDDQRREILRFDCTELARTLNQELVARVCEINGILVDRHPQWRFDVWDATESLTMISVVQSARKAGIIVPSQWAHQFTEIPVAEEGEDVLTGGLENEGGEQAKTAAATSERRGKNREQNQVDRLAETAMTEEFDSAEILGLLSGNGPIDVDDLTQKIAAVSMRPEPLAQAQTLAEMTGIDEVGGGRINSPPGR